MRKSILLLLCLSGYCCAGPLGQKKNMPILQRDDEPMIMEPASSSAEVETEAEQSAPAQEMMMMSTLTLPSNATSIRADITDNFSCENKTYGYYADVENECQIFHVCLPVTYADGKENTFRWSFICPEETVFSQESFTCMRREDMTIDCEESYKYYELNRNFGMIEEESNKNSNSNSNSNSNTMSVASEDQQVAMSMQFEQQQQPLQPIEEENLEMSAPAKIPTQVQPQAMKPVEKPVKKVQKPNRRKPVQSFTTQKKPATYPLRKAAQEAPAALEPITVQPVETVQTEKEEPIKPVVQRFTKRPSTMSTGIKERIQPGKAEATPIRVELYNQKRKRPTYFNKKDAAIAKPAEEAAASEVAQPDLNEPMPTLKIESLFNTAVQAELDASQAIVTDEKVETELPKSDSPASAADTETQASETAEVILKPEEVVEVAAEKTSEVEKAQPLVNSAPVESEKIAEPLPSEPEMISMPALEEAPKSEGTQTPIEAIEEIPAVIVEMEEQPEPAQENQAVEAEAVKTVDESHVGQTEELHQAADEPIEKLEAPIAAPEPEVAESVDDPAIFEQNSEEGSVATHNLAEMEAQKPEDAVETMAATPEMEQQDPMVQQMFEETDAHKQSMGGFKPVDPVMAAEAEALITDFLNTLRNAEPENAKPVQPIDVAEEEMHADASDNQETKLNTEENEKTESQEIEALNPAAEAAEKSDVPAVTEIQTSPLEESEQKAEAVVEPEMLKNAAPISNMQIPNFPAEMYQIPVQVIETPAEEMQNEEKLPVENTEALDDQPEVPQEAQMAANYMPLSIDDIVELVKERLDQVPAAEKGTPIEMVMEQVSEEKPEKEVEKATEAKQTEELSAEQQTEEKSAEQQTEEKSAEQQTEEKPTELLAEEKPMELLAEEKPTESLEEDKTLKLLAEEKPMESLTEEKQLELLAEEKPVEQQSEEKPVEQQSEEEIVMPIYHRVSEVVDSNMLKAQNPTVNEVSSNSDLSDDKPEENVVLASPNTEEKLVQTEDAQQTAPNTEIDAQGPTATDDVDAKTKASRAYRSRSMKNAKMDPRKRRFLFRSDSS